MYGDNINTKVYLISKLLFGKHWKTNLLLSDSTLLRHDSLPFISEDYFISYQYWNTSKTELKEKASAEYEFNSTKQLTKKTYFYQNFLTDFESRTETLYKYQ